MCLFNLYILILGVAGMAAQVRQYFEDSSFWATTCATAGLSFYMN
jgi:hypothetical protein